VEMWNIYVLMYYNNAMPHGPINLVYRFDMPSPNNNNYYFMVMQLVYCAIIIKSIGKEITQKCNT